MVRMKRDVLFAQPPQRAMKPFGRAQISGQKACDSVEYGDWIPPLGTEPVFFCLTLAALMVRFANHIINQR